MPMVEVPTGLAVFLAILGVGGWLLAAIAFGLWLGERRSSETLENVARYGKPHEPERAQTYQRPEPEEEVVQEIEEQAIDSLAEDLKARAKRLDENITDQQAREEAERLLRQGFAKAGGATRT